MERGRKDQISDEKLDVKLESNNESDSEEAHQR